MTNHIDWVEQIAHICTQHTIAPEDACDLLEFAGRLADVGITTQWLVGFLHDTAVLGAALRATQQSPAPYPTRLQELTPREHEVLQLLVTGATNRMIADRLGITLQTTKNHILSMCHKLGVRTRVEAIKIAIQRGLVPLRGVGHVGAQTPSPDMDNQV